MKRKIITSFLTQPHHFLPRMNKKMIKLKIRYPQNLKNLKRKNHRKMKVRILIKPKQKVLSNLKNQNKLNLAVKHLTNQKIKILQNPQNPQIKILSNLKIKKHWKTKIKKFQKLRKHRKVKIKKSQ